MATFDSKDLVDDLMRGNGRMTDDQEEAPDNMPAIKIVEYVNAYGRTTWGVVFQCERDINRYERETEFVRSPRVIWTRK